jgi:hypothetical protein
LFSTYIVGVVGNSSVSAKDKMPVFLSDVFGLDLSKYSVAEEGYGTHYEMGGLVEVDGYSCTLVNSKGGQVAIHGTFHNGFPYWFHISPRSDDPLYYVLDPLDGSVKSMKSFFERYVVFAQKYGIPTIDKSVALDLFSRAPSNLPASQLSAARVALDDVSLYISQEGFGFGSIIDGVEVPNKSLGLTFVNNVLTFSDSFTFYEVSSCVNFFSSEDEFTSFAFGLAQKFCEDYVFYQVGEGGVEVEVRPDWSDMWSDVSLKMISGQQFNNALNDALLAQGVGISSGGTVREASVLYPFWSAIFYFSRPVGNVVGVQVGVWGDTGDVAYCYEYGFLGGFYGSSAGTPIYDSLDDGGSGSSNPINHYGYLLLGGVVLIVLVTAGGIFVSKKKKHKQFFSLFSRVFVMWCDVFMLLFNQIVKRYGRKEEL